MEARKDEYNNTGIRLSARTSPSMVDISVKIPDWDIWQNLRNLVSLSGVPQITDSVPPLLLSSFEFEKQMIEHWCILLHLLIIILFVREKSGSQFPSVRVGNSRGLLPLNKIFLPKARD